MKTTWRIQSRLMLLGVLPAGLIALALAIFFVHARFNDLDRSLSIRSALIARELAAACAFPLESGNRQVLQRLAERAAQEEDVVAVSIVDAQAKVLIAEGHPALGAIDPPHLTQTAAIFAVALPQPITEMQTDSDTAEPAAPLPTGFVKLLVSRAATLKRQQDTLMVGLTILLTGLVGTALLARYIGRKISRPIMALTNAVHQLSIGNMDARVETEAEAELAYLQAGFNAMAAELKKNQRTLKHQVRKSTVRLQAALASLSKRNEELETARYLAEAQTELKSKFLAQMSHEIRTPMNGIIGFAERLAKTPLREDQAESLRLINRSAKNLLTIINEILDLSKLEAGQVSLNVQRFQLRSCLEDLIALLAVKSEHSIIILWIAPEVPDSIESDPIRLQQVIANLLGNALKFSRHGRIVIRVRRMSVKNGTRLWLSVSDSGSGISPRDIAKLFSPFLQLEDYAVDSQQGTGLGLSIAKNLVENMGGGIHLASRLGKGTSVWFDLPLTGDSDPPAPPAQPLRWRVGLIDADRLSRQALGWQMEALGARVETFASTEAFSRRLDATEPPQFAICNMATHSAGPETLAWLDRCDSHGIKPLLLFPSNERRLLSYYRHRGAICLFQPLTSPTLAAALDGGNPADAGLLLPSPEAPPSQRFKSTAHLRFLIADDNEINRLLFRAQMEGFAAEIIEVVDGKAALDWINHQAFDLIFLDLQMPKLDGRQVLREALAKSGPNQHTPFIAITAFIVPEQSQSMLNEGFADCLIKPVLEAQLVELIEARLGLELMPSDSAVDFAPANAQAEDYAAAIVERTANKRELACVIAEKLFAELPANLIALQTALANQQRMAARDSVHLINGSASFAGLNDIRRAAAQLESALVADEDWPAVEELMPLLAMEIDDFVSLKHEIVQLIEAGRKGGAAIIHSSQHPKPIHEA